MPLAGLEKEKGRDKERIERGKGEKREMEGTLELDMGHF